MQYLFPIAFVNGYLADELLLLRDLSRLVLFLVILAELGVPELLPTMPARPEFVHRMLVAFVRDQRVL